MLNPETVEKIPARTGGSRPARRALLALLLLVPAPSLGVLFAMFIAPGPAGQAVYMASKLWILALPALWHLLIDRERPSWSRPRRGGFLAAAGLGIAIASAIALAYWLFGRSLIDAGELRAAAERNGLTKPWLYAGFAAYLITVNSLLEEYVWRWFVFRKCEDLFAGALGRVSSAAAVLASALFFTLHHVLALAAQTGFFTTAIASAGVFIGGAAWSWLYLRYRSVWPAWVSHAIVDVPVLAIGWLVIFAPAGG